MQIRAATQADAAVIADNIAAGIGSYREWAPPSWVAPPHGPVQIERLRSRLRDDDVWCLMALDGSDLAGHVALSLATVEDPDPPPAGLANLWQLFVRRSWQGRGLAGELMAAAVSEAGRRGFRTLRLWTPEGAAQARRFYEREGWAHTGAVKRDSPFGLPLVEYRRDVAGAS